MKTNYNLTKNIIKYLVFLTKANRISYRLSFVSSFMCFYLSYTTYK